MEINFSEEQINRLFPFHLMIDKDFKILSTGISLTKIIKNFNKRNFFEIFTIERPFRFNGEDFNGLSADKAVFYILKMKSNESLFKAQFEFINEDKGLFVLTPWFNSIEDLKENNLIISDFANYDQTFDLLHVIKNIEINTDELRQLTNQLKFKNLQLGLQEEKFRNIIENMNLGILEVDNNDIIQYANNTFSAISGFSLEELKGKNAHKLFTKKSDEKIIKEILSERIKGESGNYEVTVYTKSGDERIWFISGAPNYNDRGEIIGSIGVHLDITDRKKLEKALEKARDKAQEASKTKELFLANMSHEIRTPLNIILGMTRLIKKENLNERLVEYVNHSQYAANHLLAIINDILDISKIEFGEMKLQLNPFNLYSLSNAIESIFTPNAEEKGLNFNYSISDNISDSLLGDDLRVRQVLINLIGNSIKFTDKGYVSLKVSLLKENKETQTISFEIKDSGIGMSEEFINHIFDKFSQEANKANRKYAGTGLGMAICRDLLALMNSQLKIESFRGRGTTISFDIEFKKSINNSSLPLTKISNLELNNISSKKVLLVEDNKINRLIAGKSLEILGCTFEEAINGIEAIEILKNQSFDLILMDIQMPDMDGVEATKIIRQEMKITTPIVALTANVFKQDLDSYIAVGMNDFIIKPFDEENFFEKV
ncbi:MAG: response regulator, partial [Crocinitomicaceae bacterium]